MTKIVSLEQGTCTDRAIQTEFLQRYEEDFDTPIEEIIYKPSFWQMVWYAREHPGTLMLIPHLKTAINNALSVTQIDRWRPLNNLVFPLANPPLYLANNGSKSETEICATLRDLQGLVEESANRTFLDALNTQHAAQLVAEGKADSCITNQNGVEVHGLEIRQKLKEMIILWHPWVNEEAA